jgi:hypothetical protein
MPGVHHEPGKAAYALMARDGESGLRRSGSKSVRTQAAANLRAREQRRAAIPPSPISSVTLLAVQHALFANGLRAAGVQSTRVVPPSIGITLSCAVKTAASIWNFY